MAAAASVVVVFVTAVVIVFVSAVVVVTFPVFVWRRFIGVVCHKLLPYDVISGFMAFFKMSPRMRFDGKKRPFESEETPLQTEKNPPFGWESCI